ncbi:ATP-binding protein [Stenotrophomonas sp. Ste86]|uniref:ATP-binding protein n=2 Tax=unclassified Stenotrophomonas TaxID=196198 RepID=UPI002117F74D
MARRWKCGFWLAALLAVWPCAMAATVLDLPWPHQLGLREGLPNAGMQAMAEDATGYLWLAGSDGLMRFDGRRARVWRREDGLVDAVLHALHIDSHDRLWLGTASQGVVMMPADRSGFERPDEQAPLAVRSGTIHAIASSGDGAVWVIGADRHLYRHASDNPRWQRVDTAADAVTALARDRDGMLWVGTSQGLRRIRDGRAQRVGVQTVAVHTLWPDPHGGMHVGSTDTAWTLAADGGALQPVAPGRPLLRSADGVLWQQQAAGLMLHRGPRAQPVALRPVHGPRARSVEMRQALQDQRGDIWLLSRAHGLWRLPARWRAFTALPAAANGLPGIRSHYALALTASRDGRLWVAGSQGRLQRLDLRTGASSDHLTYPHEGFSAVAVGMAEDPRQRLWIASAGQMLRYDPARGEVRRWPLALPSGDGAMHLQACPDGSVWLAHAQQIQQWSAGGVRLHADAPQALGLARGRAARQLLCDRTGMLWATDREGLKYWDATRRRFVAAEVQGTPLAAVAEGDDGSLWLSRQDALEQHRWEGQRLRRVRRFDAAAGYPLLRADALAVDAHGTVWAGAARGLIRLDPGDGQVCVLGSADGLPVQEILGQRLVRVATGALAAAVREGGLLLLEPGSVRQPQPVPTLVINAVRLQRRGTALNLRPGVAPTSLSSTDRNIQIAVNLLGPGDPDRIQHRFRLAGQDPDWVDTGPVAQRIFARLPVGEHVVAVQARHGDGPWSAPRDVALQVAPAWWQTLPGRIGLTLAGALALLTASRTGTRLARWRRRLLSARLQHRRAERVSAERTRFLGRLGHRIRVPMTVVCGWSELLLQAPLSVRQRAQADSLHRAGRHLVQLVDDALDLASIEAGRLHLQPGAFAPAALLHELHALLLPVAAAKQLRLAWDSSIDPQRWLLGDVRRLRQILLNLIGNAVKFTAQGSVQVSARCGAGGRGLVLVVTDTGPGMSAEQVRRLFQRFEQADGAVTLARHGGSGLGLAISRELAQAMGGDIQVHTRPGQGSRFEVRLPLPDVAGPPALATPAGAPDGTGAPARRVVLLLPHADTTAVVAALSRAQGQHVVCLPQVAEDVAAWPAVACDLVVADPDLRISGERVAALLARCWPGVPRVALTPRADAAAERDALAAGFSGFLRLPLSGEALAVALRACTDPR